MATTRGGVSTAAVYSSDEELLPWHVLSHLLIGLIWLDRRNVVLLLQCPHKPSKLSASSASSFSLHQYRGAPELTS